MNSQDKPLEANDNLDGTLDSNPNQQEKDDLADLWTPEEDPESTTEFINAADANFNVDDIEVTEIKPSETTKKPPKKDIAELDFDNWDFRDALSADADSESEPEIVPDVQSELLSEISQEDDSEIEALGEFEALVSQTEEPLEDASLDEFNLDADDSEIEALGEFEALISQTEEPLEELAWTNLI